MRSLATIPRCAPHGTAPGFRTRWAFRRTVGVFVRPPALARPPARRRSRRPAPDHADLCRPGTTPCSVATLVATWPAAGVAIDHVAQRAAPRAPGPPASRPSASRPRMRGDAGTARPKSGCSPSAIAAPRRAPSTTSCICPPTASLRALVRLAHQRWAIEQQYQELKDELGLDHFEGRSLPGWQRHVALIAVAYTFLQVERQRRPVTRPHAPARPRHPAGSPDRALLRHAPALLATHAQAAAGVTADLTKYKTLGVAVEEKVQSPARETPASDDLEMPADS